MFSLAVYPLNHIKSGTFRQSTEKRENIQTGGRAYWICNILGTAYPVGYAYAYLTVDVWCLATVLRLPGSWPASSWCCWPLMCLRAQSLQRWSSPFWFSLVLLQLCAQPESSYLPVLLSKKTKTREESVYFLLYIQFERLPIMFYYGVVMQI